MAVGDCETKAGISPDSEDWDKDTIRLCGKDDVCLLGDRAANSLCFALLGSYFGYGSNRGPCSGGLLIKVNKYNVGFLEDWGSIKHCVTEVETPFSDYLQSSGLFDRAEDLIQEVCKLLLALRLHGSFPLWSFRGARDVRQIPPVLVFIAE